MIWLALSKPIWTVLPWPVLWYALWISRDWRRRKAYAAHIVNWSDDVLEPSLTHYLTIVAQTRAARFPKPSRRNADNALIMATVIQERIDLAQGRTPSRYLRSRRDQLCKARRIAKSLKR